MAEQTQEELYQAAMSMIGGVAQLPIVRVEREAFLRSQFADTPYLEQVLELGPQAVFKPEALRKRASKIINASTRKTAVVSFAAGLPSNPIAMVATGGADVAQYFAFAINLAQQLAYLFGEDELFANGGKEIPEEAKVRIIAYLGTMLGAGGAAALVSKTSEAMGKTMGKRLAGQALTKTVWYPLVKKVGAVVGQQVTKKTVEKTVTKAVPIIGGVISGALSYASFKPMGEKLADVFERNLKGEFDDEEMELNPDFAAMQYDESFEIEVCEE